MKNCVRFDWFSFTLKGISLDNVISDLGLNKDDFERRDFGRYGYHSMVTHVTYDICIMFDGTEDMGIHVVVSGSSIKYFMDCFLSVHGEKTPFGLGTEAKSDFHAFAEYVLKRGRFSRVDVNIDTDLEFLNPYNIRDCVKNGDYISLYRSWNMYEGSDGSGTFYFGHRTSPSFIRIYDKAKEQGDFTSTLYRFEVQFNKAANEFMQNFLNHGLSETFLAFIKRQLRFTPDAEYHREPFPEWMEFLSLIKNGDECKLVKYESKKRKNALNSLYFMFTQYQNVVDTFLTDFGDLDDFVEFMFKVVSCPPDDTSNLMEYIESKGWEMP